MSRGVVVSAPKRIQRSRSKGWRMPEGAVYVGRPTKWGNPYWIGSNLPEVFVTDGLTVLWSTPRADDASRRAREFAVRRFRDRLEAENPSLFWFEELRGKDLACWCPLDEPCHADVLLEWANR